MNYNSHELLKVKESAKKKIKEAIRTHLLHGVVNDADLTAEDTEAQVIFSLIDRCNTPGEIDDLLHVLWNKIKLGFTFDEQPINKTREILVLEKDKSLSFQSKNDPTQLTHKLIIGDNFDTLNNLLISYENKIDVIYIDPPYNTGGSDLGYKDRFGKNAWLNFMKARMQLTRKLLKDDGVCFISIDDNMQAYIKILMDEIFGEENFVACLPRTSTTMGKNDEQRIASSHDYVLCYSHLRKFNKDESAGSDAYVLEDENGKYHLKNTLDVPGLPYTKSLDFPISFNGKIFNPVKHPVKQVSWRWCKELVEWGIKNKMLVEKNGRLYTKTYQNLEIDQTGGCYNLKPKEIGGSYKTQLLMENEFGNRYGDSQLTNLGIKFAFPKPTTLIKKLVSLIPNNKKFIILDFFAGSGTTGQAVLELNKEDKGTRQYILATCLDYDEPNDNKAIKVCYERLYRVMNGKSTDGKTDFPWAKEHPNGLGDSLDVYRLKSIDCSLLTTVNLYDLIDENDYDMKFKTKLEKINWVDTRFSSLLSHLIKDK